MSDARRRVLLYGVLLLVAGVLAVLWARRKAADREDRLAYLRGVLQNLDLVLAADPSGKTALEALSGELADPELPADLRRDVTRARAFVHVRRGEREEAEACLDAAFLLGADPLAKAAIGVERAIARTAPGDPEGALLLLGGPPPEDPVLRCWHALARADALRLLDRPEEAVQALEAAQAALPEDLPAGPDVTVAMTLWTPVGAAERLAQGLRALTAKDGGPDSGDRSEEPPPGLKPPDGPGR